MSENWIVGPDAAPRTVRLQDGRKAAVPEDWALLEPGDATLTRRVKAAGPSWTVQEMRGRKKFSQGVWAPENTIVAARAALEAERATPAYQKKLAAGRLRSAKAQEKYVAEFEASVREYLSFNPRYASVAEVMAARVTAHATPVGSGTVARTQRIPVERRAEAAVIAWMRHQTTGYDDMVIPRVKGARREARRMLAKRSKSLLGRYRRGDDLGPTCPLREALRG